MSTSFRMGAAALAAALGLMAGSAQASVEAPAQGPPSAEQVQLSLQLSEEMLGVIKFENVVGAAMAKSLPVAGDDVLGAEPKWKGFMVDAMTEELRADREVIVAMLGRELAKQCTADELRVGVVLFRDPSIPQVFDAAMKGEKPPASLRPQAETMKALATPAGQSFAAKLGGLGTFFSDPHSEFSRAMLPGFIRRFGDKAVAYERQRRLAAGLPAGG